ncbi:MAG: hypothetical protein HYU41_07065 [Candidatus Rokubacteria bacterium]|nr:hypothetical protein [Candidatus Rokubacteria bacterium]
MTHAFWAIFVAILVAVMWFVDLGTVMWAIASVAVVLFAVAYIGLPITMLSRYHALLVARFEAEHGLGAANREPLAPGATTLTMLREATKHAIAVQRAGGLIEPVPGATEVYRPTWRTAIRTGWARIPPVEEFVAQRVRARGERLARSLDGGAGALPLAECIGRRPGWALLVLGVAVATYAAATSLGAASVAFVGIYVARQIARRRGRTPGWRTVLGGGAAAAVPFGVIAALPILTVLDATAVPGFAMTAAVMVLPLVTLFSLGAAAAVEGFRAAAS